jgi:hypothetical protein
MFWEIMYEPSIYLIAILALLIFWEVFSRSDQFIYLITFFYKPVWGRIRVEGYDQSSIWWVSKISHGITLKQCITAMGTLTLGMKSFAEASRAMNKSLYELQKAAMHWYWTTRSPHALISQSFYYRRNRFVNSPGWGEEHVPR